MNSFEYGQLFELTDKRHTIKYAMVIDALKAFGDGNEYRLRVIWPNKGKLYTSNVYSTEGKLLGVRLPEKLADNLLTQYHTQKY